jgi:hypothetical protein
MGSSDPTSSPLSGREWVWGILGAIALFAIVVVVILIAYIAR